MAMRSVLYEVRRPSSLTMVLTELMALAEGVISSTRAMTSSFHGMETEQPRMPRPRTPAMASRMSVAEKAL